MRREGILLAQDAVPSQYIMHTHIYTYGQFISANSCAGMFLEGGLKPENPEREKKLFDTCSIYSSALYVFSVNHP